jgi:hypothetical protein
MAGYRGFLDPEETDWLNFLNPGAGDTVNNSGPMPDALLQAFATNSPAAAPTTTPAANGGTPGQGGGVMGWLRSSAFGGDGSQDVLGGGVNHPISKADMLSRMLLGAAGGVLSQHGVGPYRSPWLGAGLLGAGEGAAQARQEEMTRQQTQFSQGYKTLASQIQMLNAQAALAKANRGQVVPAGATLTDNSNKPIYTAPPAPTDVERELTSAGLQPGTPEYKQTLINHLVKPQADVKIGAISPQVIMPEVRGPSLTYESDKKRMEDLGQEAAQAQSRSGDINTLVDMSIHGAQPGGALANFKAGLTNIGTSLGMKMDPADVAAANDTKLYDQLRAYMQPRMRVAGTGSSSDRDMTAFGKTLPAVTDTKMQQVMMALSLKQQNDYIQKVAQAHYEYLNDPNNKRADLAGVGDYVKQKIGDSWLPRMTPAQAKQTNQDVMFLDPSDGRIKVWLAE